jgi:hypothetical protein
MLTLSALIKYLFYGFLLYIWYKFIFRFVIPVYKTTKQVKKQFGDMQQKMQEQFQQQTQFNTSTTSTADTQKPSSKDYIDFEEVK